MKGGECIWKVAGETNKDQLSLTNPRDSLHHGERAANKYRNVDVQCNKLATKLIWQRFASKVADFQLPRLHSTHPTGIWCLHWGWPRLSFAKIFSTQKLESLAVSVEHRLVTDTQRQLIPTLTNVPQVKIGTETTSQEALVGWVKYTLLHVNPFRCSLDTAAFCMSGWLFTGPPCRWQKARQWP